jgi:hypothetical protein
MVIRQQLILLVKQDNIAKYSGRIEEFLAEQRHCKNIHFHESMSSKSDVEY